MFRIDDATAVAVLPTPEAVGTPGYFTEGSPGVQVPTNVRASFMNMLQEEFINVVTDPAVSPAITPSKTAYSQVITAIKRLIGIQATETVQGTAKVATQALTDAGVDDTTAITPKKVRSGFASSFGVTNSSGYIKFPSWLGGFIIQWLAQINVPANSVTTSFTLPLTYPNAHFVAIGSFSGVSVGSFGAGPNGLNQISATNSHSAAQSANVISIGR